MATEFTTTLSNPGVSELLPFTFVGPLLTSREEIERLYSQIGVDIRTPLAEDPDFLLLEEIMCHATETIASYTLSHYETADLVGSAYIRRRATILAAFYLSERKGNPPQFVAAAKRVMEDLELIRTNKIIIPDARVRAADVPTVHSHRVDDRYLVNKQRVVASQSTKPYPGQQKYDVPWIGE